MTTENFLASRFARDVLLLSPDAAPQVRASVIELARNKDLAQAIEHAQRASSASEDFWNFENDSYLARLRPYNVKDGVLQIPVMGVLLHRFPYQLGTWATGYEYIERAFERGRGDANVRGIAFIVDSFGGEAAGCFELVNKLSARRAEKPTQAFVADYAFSAGYAVASAASEIVVTQSGGVGSVGVITMHVDYSKMLEDYGMTVTLIFAGKHKADGNPYEALPESVKNRIQARVNKKYGQFVAIVAANRDMTEDAVRATEALTYDADDGVEVGFADRIGAFDEELDLFVAKVSNDEEGQDMAQKEQTTEAAADAQPDNTAALAAARAEGATAERQRISAILGCDAAKDRPVAAMQTALRTDMSTDAAQAFLASLPVENAKKEEAATTGTTPFAAAMQDTPEVGHEAADKADADESEDALSARILASHARATGAKAPAKAA